MQPVFNFQDSAVFGVLAFLASGFWGAVTLAAAAFSWYRRWKWIALGLLATVIAGLGLYAVVLLTFSFSSRAPELALGEEKYFCEVDCHLAYSATGVREAKTLGSDAHPVTARGAFRVVTLQVRFDERTTSPTRPREVPLTPNPRRVYVDDAAGNRYEISPEGQAALAAAGERTTPLTEPLRPGESYTTQLVFDLPGGADKPRLFVTEADWPSRLLIGHENSFFHGKASFLLTSRREVGD